MKTLRRAWVAAVVLMPLASRLYGQTTPFADNEPTMTGNSGFARDTAGVRGTSSTRDTTGGINRIDRSARFGARSGSRTGSDDGVAGPQRIDRSKTSAGGNPLAPRGINVRAGDATQGQGNPDGGGRGPVITDNTPFQPSFDHSDGNRLNQAGARSERRPQYITRMISGSFAPPTGVNDLSPRADAVTAIQQSLSGLQAGRIEVELDGGTVVLYGTVACEADRRIAERTAMLEPAVRQVRNELVVTAPTADR